MEEQKHPSVGFSVISLILGILDLMMGCCLGPLVTGFALFGMIISIIALINCKKGTGGAKGVAVAGLIMNTLSFLYGGISIILVVVLGPQVLATLGVGASVAGGLLTQLLEYLTPVIGAAFVAGLSDFIRDTLKEIFFSSEQLALLPEIAQEVQTLCHILIFK